MRLAILSPLVLALAVSAVAEDTLEFTSIHTQSTNWLVTTFHPLEGCRRIVVDSVRVADSATIRNDGVAIRLIGPSRRQVEIWWHTDSVGKGSLCSSVARGARHNLRLPSPRKSPGNDTLLAWWTVDEVVSHGPGGLDRRVPVSVVDQANDGVLCPLYSCIEIYDTVVPPLQEVKDSLESWIRDGGSLALVTSGGAPMLVEGDIQDTGLVRNLGRISPWNLGNRVWSEDLPVQVLQSWGEPVPRGLRKSTGRRLYQWVGDGETRCCDGCDTVCGSPWIAGPVVHTGENLSFSNDSTRTCWGHEIDVALQSELGGRWLLRPIRAEVAEGRLRATLSLPGTCGGSRERAFQVVRDSLLYRAGKYALAKLLPLSGAARKEVPNSFSVRNQADGWTVVASRSTKVVLRDLRGRVLFQGAVHGILSITAPHRGAYVLQTEEAAIPLMH